MTIFKLIFEINFQQTQIVSEVLFWKVPASINKEQGVNSLLKQYKQMKNFEQEDSTSSIQGKPDNNRDETRITNRRIHFKNRPLF
jgi:hypothetical protein